MVLPCRQSRLLQSARGAVLKEEPVAPDLRALLGQGLQRGGHEDKEAGVRVRVQGGLELGLAGLLLASSRTRGRPPAVQVEVFQVGAVAPELCEGAVALAALLSWPERPSPPVIRRRRVAAAVAWPIGTSGGDAEGVVQSPGDGVRRVGHDAPQALGAGARALGGAAQQRVHVRARGVQRRGQGLRLGARRKRRRNRAPDRCILQASLDPGALLACAVAPPGFTMSDRCACRYLRVGCNNKGCRTSVAECRTWRTVFWGWVPQACRQLEESLATCLTQLRYPANSDCTLLREGIPNYRRHILGRARVCESVHPDREEQHAQAQQCEHLAKSLRCTLQRGCTLPRDRPRQRCLVHGAAIEPFPCAGLATTNESSRDLCTHMARAPVLSKPHLGERRVLALGGGWVYMTSAASASARAGTQDQRACGTQYYCRIPLADAAPAHARVAYEPGRRAATLA
eukprot:scaffold2377_cov376-Prasinococcus_capsulatus_cf.AAC.3